MQLTPKKAMRQTNTHFWSLWRPIDSLILRHTSNRFASTQLHEFNIALHALVYTLKIRYDCMSNAPKPSSCYLAFDDESFCLSLRKSKVSSDVDMSFEYSITKWEYRLTSCFITGCCCRTKMHWHKQNYKSWNWIVAQRGREGEWNKICAESDAQNS